MPGARTLFIIALLAGSAIASLLPSPAQGQVRRCTGPDGATIFTDRRCNDIGATERLPRDTAATGSSRVYRSGCSRNLQDLIYELTSAIDNRDVNRLAGVYHWPGMSSKTGYATLDRLNAIVKRPLVDIVPITPAARVEAPPSPDSDPEAPGDAAPASSPPADDYYPQSTVRRAPVGLRLEQTLANGSTPSRTVLGLRRHLGCLWVTF